MILSELSKRVLVAFLVAPPFLFVVWYGGPLFLALMFVVGILIQRELIQLLDLQGFRPNAFLSYFSWVLLYPLVVWPEYTLLTVFGVTVLQISVETVNKHHRQLFRLMSTIFCTAYPAISVLSFVMLRNFESVAGTGFEWIVLLLLMIWGNDTFAYFIGKNFGRHLMAPHLSPKKTWEGFAGGFFGAATGLLLALQFCSFGGMNWVAFAPLVILVSIFGPIGDLAASKIKRASGVKDCSNLFPGHGGMLDRFDSLTLAAPVVLIYVSYLFV